jgi:hypothetical protein
MNPLYQQLMGGVGASAPAHSRMQMFNMAMSAMQNPAAFVKQQFPDIPNEIANNPNAILDYLQRTRGIAPAQIQQLSGQLFGNGMMR